MSSTDVWTSFQRIKCIEGELIEKYNESTENIVLIIINERQ